MSNIHTTLSLSLLLSCFLFSLLHILLVSDLTVNAPPAMSDQPAVMASKEVEASKRVEVIKEVEASLGTDFVVEPGMQEDVCVDLEGEWREDSLVTRHPDCHIPNLEFVSGAVGEGGDHVNITYRNTGQEPITVDKERVVLLVREVAKAEQEELTINDSEGAVNDKGKDENIEDSVEKDNPETVDEDKSSEDNKLYGDTDEVEQRTQEPSHQEEESMEIEDAKKQPSEEEEQVAESYESEEMSENVFMTSEEEVAKTSVEEVTKIPEEEVSKSSEEEASKTSEEKAMKTTEEEEPSNGVLEDKSSSLADKPETSQAEGSDTPKIRFVNETVEERGEERSEDTDEAMDTEEDNTTSAGSTKPMEDGSASDENSRDERPTLKLASFSSMATKTSTSTSSGENGTVVKEDGCYSCGQSIESIYRAVVWEAMQFCNEVNKKSI